MQSDTVHTSAGPAVVVTERPLPIAHHFASWSVQNEAARLGMWMFLSTEVLLFAGLFLLYAGYRYLFPAAWIAGSASLDLPLGLVNTLVLISSSLTVALAVDAAKQGANRRAFWLLVFTLVCAVAFMVIKGIEYQHKFHVGTLPGIHYTNTEMTMPGISLFYSVYFAATGFHAFHVIVGASVLLYLTVRAWKGHFHANNYVAMELGGLLWHLIDLVWIFLFPLLYLV